MVTTAAIWWRCTCEPGVAHDWVGRSLKLDQYAIAKGGWDYQGGAVLVSTKRVPPSTHHRPSRGACVSSPARFRQRARQVRSGRKRMAVALPSGWRGVIHDPATAASAGANCFVQTSHNTTAAP